MGNKRQESIGSPVTDSHKVVNSVRQLKVEILKFIHEYGMCAASC